MILNIFNPLVRVFNNLKFITKILIVSVILFLPTLYPTYKYTVTQFHKKDDISKSLIGLKYNDYIYNTIILIAKHRGLINGYDGKNKNLKKTIQDLENKIDKLIKEYFEYDKNQLNILSINSNFIQLFSYDWEFLKVENLPTKFNKEDIFKRHSKLINNILSNRQARLEKTHFYSKEIPKLNQIAQQLSYQIPSLSETIGRLRGIGTKIFLEKKLTEDQKDRLLGLISTISEKIDTLKNNKLTLSNSSKSTISLNIQIIKIIKEFNKTLNEVESKILKNQTFDEDPKKFFLLATKTINELDNYYNILSNIYKEQVNKKQNELSQNIFLVLLGLFAITILTIYLVSSLYISVIRSLKVLKQTSLNFLNKEFDKTIEYSGKDEIADAIDTFNKMSNRLKNNITFLNNYKYAIDNTSIVSKTDKKGIITYVNKKFCQISGYSEKELLGRPHNIIRHPDMPKEAFKDLWQTIKSGKTWHGIVKNRKKNGGYYIVDATIFPMYDANNNFIEYVAVRHDITELEKQKELQLYDKLTNLPKREKLLDDTQKIKKPVLITLNIKEFSSLNKFYGYEISNKILIELSKLLTKLFSNINASVYKLYADEFAILLDGETFNKKAIKNILSNYIQIIESTDLECNNSNCINIKVYSGVAMCSDESAHELQLNADLALKQARVENKKIQIFDSSIHDKQKYIENINWIKKIEKAIQDDKIVPFFQPIVDNKTQTIQKYETLVRLIDENDKIISPFFFLDIAKRANLYHKITQIVINKSFEKFSEYPELEFSINLTSLDLLHKETVTFILDKLREFNRPQRVIFEIVESEDITDYVPIDEFIAMVKNYGVKIAIDDFGSGYSSFERILKLKPDYIKIDGSLVKNIDTDKDARSITKAIVAFSHNLGLKVIAEYIHSKVIQEHIENMGCDYSQGFYFGEPSPTLKSFEEYLQKEQTKEAIKS